MFAFISRATSRLLNGSIDRFASMKERFREGDHLGVISLFIQMHRERAVKPERPLFLLLLKASANFSSNRLGISLHSQILKFGLQADVFITTALVDMLCKFSDIEAARKVFDEMPARDVAAWNAMLSGYAKHGYVDQALSLFREMGCCGVERNSLTLSVLLQVCCGVPDERLGRCVHAYAYRHAWLADTFLCNSLLVYYNHCGCLFASECLFESMVARDIVSWNAMMSGYTKNGFAWRALEACGLLREEGLAPDLVSVETALQACAQIGEEAIHDGEMIHALLFKFGFLMDVYVDNCLLHMYCKCGKMETAQYLFDRMDTRNTVSSNIIIHGYIQINEPKKAMAIIRQLCFVEAQISSEVLVDALQAVKLLGSRVEFVMCMHCLVIKTGYDSDVFVSSSLIDVYGVCGEAEFARSCLDYLVEERKNATVCYNTMLSVYLHHGYFSEAVELLGLMHHNGCGMDSITLVNTVSICARHLDLKLGRVIHGYILKNRFVSDIFVSTSLIELYSKCGHLRSACSLFSQMSFRNIVSWNSLIHSCVENGFPRVSLKLFFHMQLQDGLMPDSTSVVGAVESIRLRGYESERKYIHDFAVQSGLVKDEYVANALITMHARFHDFEKARLVFDKACKDRTIIWNTFMSEYTYHGLLDNAVSVFHLMMRENISPDSVTILCLLRICACLGSLSCTNWVHALICKNGHDSDTHVETSLLDVYAKCGDLHIARLLFDKMNSKTVISWNSMIQAYGIHGNVEEASNLFSQMQQSGFFPTIVTFLILISACSHAGDVEKGWQYIGLMTQAYSLSPGREHLSSFIDLLGRKGLIKEAYEFLENVPVNAGISAWGALIGACRAQGNLKVGLAAAEKVFDMDPLHCGYYTLLSNMFMEAGRCIDAFRIRSKVEKMQLKKEKGCTMVENIL